MNTKEQSTILISVIICTYNRGHLLKRALNSVLRQTFNDYELIVIDDGSIEDIKSIINLYSKQFQDLKYFRHQHKGTSFSRNKGISIAQGSYITFLDSDDEYKEHHLKEMVSFIKKIPDIDFIHSFPEIIGTEDDMWLVSAADQSKLIHVNDCVYGGTFFAKKEVFVQMNGFKDVPYGEDYDFFTRLNSNSKFKIQKSSKKTYVYHRNVDDSVCNAMKRKRQPTSE